jgi:hypothetical protein
MAATSIQFFVMRRLGINMTKNELIKALESIQNENHNVRIALQDGTIAEIESLCRKDVAFYGPNNSVALGFETLLICGDKSTDKLIGASA